MRGKALSPWWSPPQEWDLPFEQTDRVREREREISDSVPDRHLPANLPSFCALPKSRTKEVLVLCILQGSFCLCSSVAFSVTAEPGPPLPKNTAHNHTTTHAERLFAVIMSLAVQFTAETREVWPWSEVLHLAVFLRGIILPFTQVQIYVRYHMAENEIRYGEIGNL